MQKCYIRSKKVSMHLSDMYRMLRIRGNIIYC